MTVGELLERMDSAEMTEWVAYYKLQADEILQLEAAARADQAAREMSANRKPRRLRR